MRNSSKKYMWLSSHRQAYGFSPRIYNREIRIEYEDNGCEARNVMLLYPEWNNQELIVDGVYSIVNISESEDGLIILCMCGDFYSHEEPVDYLLKIQNDELVLLTIE